MVFGGWNFSPEPPSYLSDELIVSRFSSLSGCLNPKVKAFSPPVYIPFTGGFLFRRPLEPLLEAVAAFVDAFSRNARKKRHPNVTKTRPELEHKPRRPGAPRLVLLGHQDQKRKIPQHYVGTTVV